MQNRIPTMSKRWPSIAPLKKDTEDRSGNFRLASPLACSGWARAMPGAKMESRKAKEANLATRDQQDATLAGQMRIRIPPMMTDRIIAESRPILRGEICAFQISEALPHSEHAYPQEAQEAGWRHRTLDAVCPVNGSWGPSGRPYKTNCYNILRARGQSGHLRPSAESDAAHAKIRLAVLSPAGYDF